MSKKLLASAAASAALAVTGANAAPPEDGACAANEIATISAVHGVIDCKPEPKVGGSERFTPREERASAPLVETTLSGGNSKFGAYGQGGAQVNIGKLSLAANALGGKDELRALITAGVSITPELALISGVGYAREDAGKSLGNEKYIGKDLEGKSVYVRLEYALPRSSPLATAFLEWMRAKGETTHLETTYSTSIDTRTREFATFVQTIQTTSFFTTNTQFTGGTFDILRAGATLHIGQSGELTLTAGSTRDRNGTRAIGGLGYTHFMGDTKWTLSALTSEQARKGSLRIDHILSGGLTAYIEGSQTRTPGQKADNRVGVGVSYALGGKNTSYSRSEKGLIDLAGRVRELAPDHQTHGVGSVAKLGNVESITTVKTTEKETRTAKIPEIVKIDKTTVNPDGSVTMNFASDARWAYECQIDGKEIVTCVNPMTTPVLSAGAHTLRVRAVNNTVKGDLQRSLWTEAKVNIFADTEALVLAPEIISIGYTSVSFRYRISDVDGVRNQTCSVNGKTVTPDKDGICTITGLTPGERVTLTTKGEVNVKQPNGSDLWVPKEISTPVTLSIATDAPTIITLDVANVTTNSLLAKCNIDDRNGATGTCTLRDANNQVVASGPIGADRPITGLLPGTTYTLALVGTAVRQNPDGTLSNVGINRLLVVSTVQNTLPVPAAPVLSATVSGNTVTLSCPAVIGATSYEFYQGSTLLGISPNCAYTVSGLADGSYTFTAKARNSTGLSQGSNVQTVNVSNVPTLPATLPDIGPIGDNGGGAPVSFTITMPSARPYTVTGLPSTDGFGTPVNWNISVSGSNITISGIYIQGTFGITTIPLSITSPTANGVTVVNVKIQGQ